MDIAVAMDVDTGVAVLAQQTTLGIFLAAFHLMMKIIRDEQIIFFSVKLRRKTVADHGFVFQFFTPRSLGGVPGRFEDFGSHLTVRGSQLGCQKIDDQ